MILVSAPHKYHNTPAPRRPRGDAGLTLVEVMAALLIFSLTATAVMRAATEHLRGVAVLEDMTFATYVANNRVTQISLEEKWPLQNGLKGTQELAGRTWHWQQTITKTQEANMLSVAVSVSLDSAGQEVITTITTFVANPNITPSSRGSNRGSN